MANSLSNRNVVPEGWHTITPRMVVQGAQQLVEFLAQVFDATGEFQETRPSEVWIGDSVVMVSEAGIRNPMPTFLYVYVADTDAVYARALKAGVQVVEEPFDTPYGDRRCMVEDRWGNVWQVATYRKRQSAT